MRQLIAVATMGFAMALPLSGWAAEYDCEVRTKIDWGHVFAEQQLLAGRFSVRIVDHRDSSTVSRCSFAASEGKVTCDTYSVDMIEFDENARVKKYYVLRSQFDVQLFSNLGFVENNGRGGIAYGVCVIVAP